MQSVSSYFVRGTRPGCGGGRRIDEPRPDARRPGCDRGCVGLRLRTRGGGGGGRRQDVRLDPGDEVPRRRPRDLPRPAGGGDAAEQPHGAGRLRRREPRHERPLAVSRHGPLAPRSQHAGVRRGAAALRRARTARGHDRPPGRLAPSGRRAPELARERLSLRRLAQAGVARATRPRRPCLRHPRHRGDPEPLLLRSGLPPGERGGGAARHRRRHRLAARSRIPERARRDQQRDLDPRLHLSHSSPGAGARADRTRAAALTRRARRRHELRPRRGGRNRSYRRGHP